MRHVLQNVAELAFHYLLLGWREGRHIPHRPRPQIGVAGGRRESFSTDPGAEVAELPPSWGILFGFADGSLGITGSGGGGKGGKRRRGHGDGGVLGGEEQRD